MFSNSAESERDALIHKLTLVDKQLHVLAACLDESLIKKNRQTYMYAVQYQTGGNQSLNQSMQRAVWTSSDAIVDQRRVEHALVILTPMTSCASGNG